MNDLEKESIECLKNMPIEETTYQVARNVVLDYITNLQHTEDLYNQLLKDYDELEQAYQELNDSKQWWNNRFNVVQRDYEDYKSRIEKAIEYIKQNTHEAPFENYKYMNISDEEIDDLLNILEGKSDE